MSMTLFDSLIRLWHNVNALNKFSLINDITRKRGCEHEERRRTWQRRLPRRGAGGAAARIGDRGDGDLFWGFGLLLGLGDDRTDRLFGHRLLRKRPVRGSVGVGRGRGSGAGDRRCYAAERPLFAHGGRRRPVS